MTNKDFEFITDKIGIWFANLKLKSFRHTFDGDIYPSSALVTDYELFIAKFKKDIKFNKDTILEEPVSEAKCNGCNNANDCENCKFEDLEDNVTWCRDKIFEKDIEYTRTDVFMEKAVRFLKEWDAYRVCLEGHKDWFIEQFKNYMKGE